MIFRQFNTLKNVTIDITHNMIDITHNMIDADDLLTQKRHN